MRAVQRSIIQRLRRHFRAFRRGDIVLRLQDAAIFIDHKMAAHDAGKQQADQRMAIPRAVGFGNVMAGVDQQRERQIVFGFEFHMAIQAIRADAEHHRVFFFEVEVVIAKAACLPGSAGGVIFGIEIENNAPAAKIAELDFHVGVGQCLEIRREITGLELAHVRLLKNWRIRKIKFVILSAM